MRHGRNVDRLQLLHALAGASRILEKPGINMNIPLTDYDELNQASVQTWIELKRRRK